jgi:DNA-binding Lrp family transcriptional regulator
MRDKKKAAEKMLVEFPEMSNNAIAKTVSINDKTVNTIRKELENDGKIEEVTKRVGADGRKTQATSSEIPKSEPIVEEEIDNEQVEEDNGNYLKVGIMQGNTIRTTKVLEGFKARSKKVVPVGMIDTITNIVNSANLPPNAEGWDMVKKIVEEHVEFFKEVMDNRNAGKQPEPKEEENDLPFVEEETMEDNGATVNSNMEATPLDSKPVSSRVEKIKEKLDEINKEQAEKVDTYIQEEINKVAGALKSPVFSKWLSKSVKARLKEIHPDISKESVEAVEFVNAWNVIKQFIER